MFSNVGEHERIRIVERLKDLRINCKTQIRSQFMNLWIREEF